MPIMRNPFRKQDENARPGSQGKPANVTTQPIDVQQKAPVEYKLSGALDQHPLVGTMLVD